MKATKQILKDREAQIAVQNAKIKERKSFRQSKYWRVK